MQQEIMNAILSALGTILVALSGYIAQKIAVYLKQKGIQESLSNKEYLVRWAVMGIEQVYKHEDGAKKFSYAKKEAIDLFRKNGLEVDSEELDLLIESVVNSVTDAVKEVYAPDELPKHLPNGK